jgi:hypothetical protein
MCSIAISRATHWTLPRSLHDWLNVGAGAADRIEVGGVCVVEGLGDVTDVCGAGEPLLLDVTDTEVIEIRLEAGDAEIVEAVAVVENGAERLETSGGIPEIAWSTYNCW